MTYIWEDISYLLNGSDKQKRAYETLKKLKVLDILKKYKPILVGTIPININIDSSDLDIICEVYDFDQFRKALINYFGKLQGFNVTLNKREGNTYIVANFFYNEFMIEIFGQAESTTKQNGYRHMIIEERLLSLGGEGFRREIIKLKKDGLKTEPAFTTLLNIEGNPYVKLLELEDLTDEKLLKLLHSNTNRNVIDT